MKKKNTVIAKIVCCARCGGNHKSVTFRPLTRPILLGNQTHWAPCPKNKQPILMKMVDDEVSTAGHA